MVRRAIEALRVLSLAHEVRAPGGLLLRETRARAARYAGRPRQRVALERGEEALPARPRVPRSVVRGARTVDKARRREAVASCTHVLKAFVVLPQLLEGGARHLRAAAAS